MKIKKRILSILKKRKKPLTVGEIMEKVSANKTTVYRDLYSLLKNGFITEVILDDHTKRYEISKTKHHHHLICKKCKMIEEIYMEDSLKEKEKHLEKITGFTSVKHNLEFYGYCSNCKQK